MLSLSLNRTMQFSLTALFILLLSTAVSAQKPVFPAKAKSAVAINNLTAGITSDNNGVKRSSIYMAGKYGVSEVLPVLFKQMAQEDDPGTKILIGLSIYNIGQPESMIRLKSLAADESNSRVKQMFNEIYHQYATDHDMTLNEEN